MLLFGGRNAAAGSGDTSWLSLGDLWLFDISDALGAPFSGSAGWNHIPLLSVEAGSTVSMSRSDHALAISATGEALVFGGLKSAANNDLFIMKDLVRITLPADMGGTGHLPSVPSSSGTASRLAMGPSWRFDMTLIIAPRIVHPKKPDEHLIDAPVVYGGASSNDIFSDIWVYSAAEDAWHRVVDFDRNGDEVPPDKKDSDFLDVALPLISITTGSLLCVLVVLCFVCRIWARRRAMRRAVPGAPAVAAMNPTRPRGLGLDAVASLPRVKWDDIVRTMGAEPVTPGSAKSPRAEAPAAARAAGGSSRGGYSGDGGGGSGGGGCSVDDEADGEVCSVCLSQFSSEEVLIRLPCDHFFHEACISRWLLQDSSCPQCRFDLYAPPARPPRPPATEPRPVADWRRRMVPNSRQPPRNPPPSQQEGAELAELPSNAGPSQPEQSRADPELGA